ncbi:MAG: UvrD-helicase domain-containing protein [Gammaproteobacteria bacterium]|nr:UvrD-helicase domain-containing protein [Gammaproteobacteria bacterium]
MQSGDQQQRLMALSADRSFIVQAPAGSGKTELLTQRYLVLLAHAQKGPEEIVAITFTRKAANEMRRRIIAALRAAQDDEAAQAPHERHTRQLAQAALQRNQQLDWQLLDNPNRLRIQTIDSFCSQLVKQMPTLSHFGTRVAPLDNPETLYRQAIAQLLQRLEQQQHCPTALITLLQHLDNDLLQVEKLFIKMLQCRDQWLPHIIGARNDTELRATMESGLQAISDEQIELLSQQFSPELFACLTELSAFAANRLVRAEKNSVITHCQHVPDPSATLEEKRHFWLGICQLLLTSQGQLRQRFDKNCGFPTASEKENASDQAHNKLMKTQMKTFVETLQQYPHIIDSLAQFQATPPLHYPDHAWKIVDALLELLPYLVAELRLVFQQHGQVDFIEIAQAALVALGEEEAPTDLALTLDYHIRHLLVDEFQDTSIAQFRLLEKLTAGWQADDGRTLFVVGDPMQSIYRFRQAEVGLFLRAQHQGIGQISLQCLTLTENFRSAAAIVDWTNQTFQQIFPVEDNIANAAVTYTCATACSHADKKGAVAFHALADEQQEAQRVVELTQQALNDEAKSIAILVKARPHLIKILAALKAAAVPYQAVEIDSLVKQPIVQDLVSLTRALLHPADRIAWLAILRAPWCGLTLAALHTLAQHTTVKNTTAWQTINDHNRIANLNKADRQRLAYLRQVMATTLIARRRHSLRQWVEQTWQALQGEACIATINEKLAADAYFDFLDTIDHSGDIQTFANLEEELTRRYANIGANDSPVQILTIHKAKGLEFDSVIVAGLGYSNRSQESALLLWHEQPRQLTATSDLILAPIKASQSSQHDAIYRYLNQQEKIKMAHEQLRLLYVATTRAKKQLHLTAHFRAEKTDAAPTADTLLYSLWPLVAQQFDSLMQPINNDEQTVIAYHPPLQRLPLQQFNDLPQPPPMEIEATTQPQSIRFHSNQQALIGTVVHAILQQIATEGIDQWPDERLNHCRHSWQALLASSGLLHEQLATATDTVTLAIRQTLADERGRWLLQHYQHSEAEFALTQHDRHFIIDRTFIDQQGQRWIIDYKISQHPIDTITKQAKSASHPWRQQLSQYAELLATLDDQPPRCALYFPLQPLFIEVVL